MYMIFIWLIVKLHSNIIKYSLIRSRKQTSYNSINTKPLPNIIQHHLTLNYHQSKHFEKINRNPTFTHTLRIRRTFFPHHQFIIRTFSTLHKVHTPKIHIHRSKALRTHIFDFFSERFPGLIAPNKLRSGVNQKDTAMNHRCIFVCDSHTNPSIIRRFLYLFIYFLYVDKCILLIFFMPPYMAVSFSEVSNRYVGWY